MKATGCRPFLIRGVVTIFTALGSAASVAGDIFGTQSNVSASPQELFMSPADAQYGCDETVSTPLTIDEAVERALCASPKTRSAWASVKAAAATLGTSKAAYLPSLDGSAQRLRETVTTDVRGAAGLRSNFTDTVETDTLSLSWLLYDFGGRSATLENARQLLLAAQATQVSVLQQVFMTTAKDYYAAQAAASKVASTTRIEMYSRDSLAAASARVTHGVAPITDQLQAQTAHAQAVFERARAVNDFRTALGTVAIDLSLDPDVGLEIPAGDVDSAPIAEYTKAIHDLMVDARRAHPKILAAEAQWRAATEKIRAVESQGKPTLKLVGEVTRDSQPISASLGQPELPALTNERYIGLRVDIPIFSGFAHSYQVQQARAEADEANESLRDTEQQVSSAVWSSYQALETDVENLRNTSEVVGSARLSFSAAQHRYASGVGNILELLAAQTQLAAAEQQQINAHSDWRSARLQLAQSLGKLGMWSLHPSER